MKKFIWCLVGAMLVTGFFLVKERRARLDEAHKIRLAYSSFRKSLQEDRITDAYDWMAPDFKRNYTVTDLSLRLGFLKEPSFDLLGNESVRIRGGSRASLRVGRVGFDAKGVFLINFVRDANVWRLAGDFVVVVD